MYNKIHVRNLLLLVSAWLLIQPCAYSYVARSAEMFRSVRKLEYINPRNDQKEVMTFKDYQERNSRVSEHFYCLMDNPNKDYGYVVYKSSTGRVSYQYQTDNYSYYERIKCDYNSSYPIFYSWQQIKSYVNNLK